MKRPVRILFPVVIFILLLSGCKSAEPATVSVVPTRALGGRTVVSLTFDDGDEDNFATGAWLEENGLTGTFYIASGLTGQDGYMSWDQLRQLAAAGNEIGGHTLHHTKLTELDADSSRREVCEDRRNLMDHGFDVTSFAYPYGSFDAAAQAIVKECGYGSARSVVGGVGGIPPADRYALSAYPYIVSDTTVGKLRRYVAEIRNNGGGWIILIFHHVCDSCDFFSVKPDVLQKFIVWLGEEQSQNNVHVLTVRDVIEGK